MQTFKDYLTEGRDFPIYHSAPMKYYEEIVIDGILPKTAQNSNKLLLNPKTADIRLDGLISAQPNREKEYSSYHGISTTRNFKFAILWGDTGTNIVFELNHAEIAKRYKILPIQYYDWKNARKLGSNMNEYEEFIVTNKPLPFNKTFIKKVWIPPATLKVYGKSIMNQIDGLTPDGIPWAVVHKYTARLNK